MLEEWRDRYALPSINSRYPGLFARNGGRCRLRAAIASELIFDTRKSYDCARNKVQTVNRYSYRGAYSLVAIKTLQPLGRLWDFEIPTSFSAERCKRVVERVLLDFAERCRLREVCLSAPLGNDYPVVSRPHESMEGDAVLRARFRHAVMQHAKSVFLSHESIYCNSRSYTFVHKAGCLILLFFFISFIDFSVFFALLFTEYILRKSCYLSKIFNLIKFF